MKISIELKKDGTPAKQSKTFRLDVEVLTMLEKLADLNGTSATEELELCVRKYYPIRKDAGKYRLANLLKKE